MTRAARVVFGVLVVASFASFFLAQRLKNQPAVVQSVRGSTAFSPDGDGRRDTLTVSFVIKRSQRVTVQMVDVQGGTVRTLARDRRMKKYNRGLFRWDGQADDGKLAADGRYRLKVVLPDEGRSIVYRQRAFELRTEDPRPSVASLAIAGTPPPRGPAILPSIGGDPVTAKLRLRGWEPSARIVRTSPGPLEVVRGLAVRVTRREQDGTLLREGGRGPKVARPLAGTTSWDGRLEDGTPAPPGTYVLQVCVRDRAGVLGCGPRRSETDGLPSAEDDGRMRGRGGITVRPVGVQPNPAPVRSGNRLTFFVDARGRRYDWALRRVGSAALVERGSSTGPLLKVRTGAARGAMYLLTVRAGGARVTVPALQSAKGRRDVLVVLPAVTWQGLQGLDDDGDGLVNTLEGPETSRATRVRVPRVLTGVPADVARAQVPVLEWLARHRKTNFQITTDLALARGKGPTLAGHRGVLLVGEHRWTTPGLAGQLRDFVRRGGTLAGLDPSSVRRSVTINRAKEPVSVLRAPGPFVAENALGLESRGAVRLDGPPQNDVDDLGLFSGTDGRFEGYGVGWPLEPPKDGRVVASAVDGSGSLVVAAVKIGDGLAVRTGLPAFASRLATDPDTSDLMESTWRLLSR